MDRLHAMRVFVRVIDEGSFAGAARALNVSPAAVTRVVADLEEHLGTRLIHRTTRRLSLTEAGETYLERVRRILDDVADAEAQAGDSNTQLRGHLRLLMPPAFAVHQMAKHLPAFRRLHPEVTLELAAPGAVETVDEGYDVTIIVRGGATPLSGDFIARPLARSEVVICAAPEYLDQRGRPTHPGELDGHDAMIPAYLRELNFHQGASGDEPQGDAVRLAARRPALATTHIDTMYAAALAGLGITGLPSFVVEDALYEQALERVLPEWHISTFTIYAAMPTRKHLPARTRAFVDFLVDTFDGRGGTIDPWLVATGCETRGAGRRVAAG